MTKKEILKIAKNKKCSISQIMKWYENAKGVRERIDAVVIMEARIKHLLKEQRQICHDQMFYKDILNAPEPKI